MGVPTVLVVDDEPAIRDVLRRWIEGWGYVVRLAASATDALDVMRATPAAILVCDIKMPNHDGLWLTERVLATWPHTAIIMASAVADTETVQRAQRAGAVDYVTKPFGRELLWQALSRAEAHL